jgi:hypothetical protein
MPLKGLCLENLLGATRGSNFPYPLYIKMLAADEILHRAARVIDENAEEKIMGLYSNTSRYYST